MPYAYSIIYTVVSLVDNRQTFLCPKWDHFSLRVHGTHMEHLCNGWFLIMVVQALMTEEIKFKPYYTGAYLGGG